LRYIKFTYVGRTVGLFWVSKSQEMDAAAPRPSAPEEPPTRDWSLLPLDVLAFVFVRLNAVDVLRGAGLVCRSWLQAAKVPDVWRVVDMGYHGIMFKYDEKEHADLRAMAKAAVDRSDGQLREFAGRSFVTDELMQYMVERCVFFYQLLNCTIV
jgi:hypothetical protein